LAGARGSGLTAAFEEALASGGARGFGGAGGRGASVDPRLVKYLTAHQSGGEYLAAVSGSTSAAPLILATGKPVMAMGGFIGSDPAPTLSQFKRLVATGQVHYVLVGGGGPAGAFGAGAGALGALGGRPPAGFPAGGVPGGFPGGLSGALGRRLPPGGFRAFGGGGRTTASTIDRWVQQHGQLVPAASYGGARAAMSLYYVSSAAAS
jgi:4-amino-4-deoxy-L-arabinose transferase-like glycosyltransferase